jgi:DNA-binding NarL/FixJ family response regulator
MLHRIHWAPGPGSSHLAAESRWEAHAPASPGRSGRSELAFAASARPSLLPIFVAMRDEQSDAIFAARAGARAFVTISESDKIVEARERLQSGQAYLSHEIIAKALASDGTTPDEPLSRRQLQVFSLLAE